MCGMPRGTAGEEMAVRLAEILGKVGNRTKKNEREKKKTRRQRELCLKMGDFV